MGADCHSPGGKDSVPVTVQPLTAVVMRSSPPSEVIPGVILSVMLGIIIKRRTCYYNGSDAASFHSRKLQKTCGKGLLEGILLDSRILVLLLCSAPAEQRLQFPC